MAQRKRPEGKEVKVEKKGLGRGLSALLADVNANEQPSLMRAVTPPDRMIPIEYIHPNPNQPRRTFDEKDLNDLANSIREKGVIQPLILRPLTDRPGEYQIVAGERRWRAAQIAERHELPAVIRDLSDAEVLELAIIENIQRADLNSVEEALGYRQLMDRFGHTQEKLAEALGKSRSHIANLLRLLALPEPVLEMVRAGQLSAGHARTLVTVANPEQLARQIVVKDLSVRQAEQMARTIGDRKSRQKARPESQKDADTRALESDLSATLRMEVLINHRPGSQTGELRIRYSTLEELDSLCQRLGQ
jgi:ParB family transcriptional regulator, chromosome partitioning protein